MVPLIAFSSIGYIPILLVLTVFLSILMVLSRAWRDSEMVIWFASGQSLTAWIRPVLSFALPYAFVVGLVALVVSPWANQQIVELRQRFEQREDVSQVAPASSASRARPTGCSSSSRSTGSRPKSPTSSWSSTTARG